MRSNTKYYYSMGNHYVFSSLFIPLQTYMATTSTWDNIMKIKKFGNDNSSFAACRS